MMIHSINILSYKIYILNTNMTYILQLAYINAYVNIVYIYIYIYIHETYSYVNNYVYT